jgi:hypothetical protein
MANEDNNDEMLRQILQSVTDLKAAMSACNSRIAALEPHSGVSFSRLPFHKSPDFPTLTTQVTTSQHFSILARSKNFFETPGCPTDRSSTPKAHQTLAGTDFGSRGPQHCVRLKNVITLCFKKLLKLLRAVRQVVLTKDGFYSRLFNSSIIQLSQSVYRKLPFPNGASFSNKDSLKIRSLRDQTRLKRCLSLSNSPPRIANVPTLYLENKYFSLTPSV